MSRLPAGGKYVIPEKVGIRQCDSCGVMMIEDPIYVRDADNDG